MRNPFRRTKLADTDPPAMPEQTPPTLPSASGAASGYRLFASPAPIAWLDGWSAASAAFTHVVGFSDLGHVFLADEQTGEHAVLHPLKNAYKNYGRFDSAADFEQVVLHDEGFRMFVLETALRDEIATRLGALGPQEVYFPVPYPFLGGSGAPDTFDRGDVRVFLAIVDRMLNAA